MFPWKLIHTNHLGRAHNNSKMFHYNRMDGIEGHEGQTVSQLQYNLKANIFGAIEPLSSMAPVLELYLV